MLRAVAVLLAFGTTGCMSGAIYSHVTVPLDVNLDRTPVHDEYARDARNTFRYYYVQIDWSSNGVGDIAKKYGFTRVYYADLETVSVLSIWRQRFARVYGERSSP